MNKKEIAEIISQHALIGVGEGNFFRLENQKGEYKGAFYRSDIDPYHWVITNGMAMIGVMEDRDELAVAHGVLIPSARPDESAVEKSSRSPVEPEATVE